MDIFDAFKALDEVDWEKVRKEKYEQEKKENEGVAIGKLYFQKYKLSQPDIQYYHWKYTDFVFSNTNDNVIIYFHYRTSGYTKRGGHGQITYDFYVVENNGEYYIRYFDMDELEGIAGECGRQAIPNLSCLYEHLVGVNTNEYRKYVLENAMSEKIPIDKNELEDNLNKIKQINFEKQGSGFESLIYPRASTRVEMLDFRNKITFFADEYVLPKFRPCVEFMEFVFEKCEIPDVKKCNLKYIKGIKKAMEILVDKEIKRNCEI